jgi:predicted alpha/beta hydrolase family esterase
MFDGGDYYMEQQNFLIIHGLNGSGPDHWQTWLSHELIEQNHQVFYPTFSNFNSPNKKVWLEELSSAIEQIPKSRSLTVITHSLGCLLWLHYASLQKKRIANQIILVAPPSPTIVLTKAKSFYPVPLNRDQLLRAADETLFVHSTNDPYCSIEDSNHYAKVGIPSLTFPDMGHINPDSGHNKWTWILDFCLNKSTVFI